VTILGQRIQLDPNNVQASFFERCAGTARFVWNHGLARWQELYNGGEKPSWQQLNTELNARKADDFPWMAELPWKVTNQALADLGAAFGHFFRRIKAGNSKPGYPRFKKRGRCLEGFAIEARALTFDGRRVRVPKLGWLRMRETLRFPGKVLSARFTKHVDHWFVSVQVEVDHSRWSYPHACKTHAVCGIDLGVRDLAVLSDGAKVEAPRALRFHEKRLKRLQRELSRRTKGGKNWRKTKARIQRVHERIANIRSDVTHKLTSRLVRDFRWIGIEDLNVSGMLKNHHLAKSVADASMSEMRRQLTYKAPLAGSEVVMVDRWFPSSKMCSDCGHVVESLPLSVRKWSCPGCGVVHDRDVNAAVNLRNIAAARAVTACGEGSADVGLMAVVKLSSAKQEAGRYVFT